MIELTALKKVQAQLKRMGVIPGAAAVLNKNAAKTGRALREAVIAEVPALSNSRNPEIAIERDQHAAEHLNEILRLFTGGEVKDFDFVRAHAQHRAEQRFPLEAILQAYHCGHKALSNWMCAAAIAAKIQKAEQATAAVAEFAIEYTNVVSAIMTAEYVTQTRRLAEAESDRRTDMLNVLLNGGEVAYGEHAPLLKRAGYLEPRQCFCVAVAQSVDPLEMRSVPRAQRIVEAITTCVNSANIRALAGVRNDVVVAVFAATQRQSGWTAARADLASRLQATLLTLGPAVIIGLSREQGSLTMIPKSLQEATVALGSSHVGDRVVRFDNLSLRRLLLHGSSEYLRSASPSWVPIFAAANTKASGALVKTLRAYADADMNLITAARVLTVHPNTLYARMKRIKALTGLDCQRFHELNELLIAADCMKD